jgi:hypothetical protein
MVAKPSVGLSGFEYLDCPLIVFAGGCEENLFLAYILFFKCQIDYIQKEERRQMSLTVKLVTFNVPVSLPIHIPLYQQPHGLGGLDANQGNSPSINVG